MAKCDLLNMKGEVVGNIKLADEIFAVEINQVAMHTVVVNQLANLRQGTQSTKTKSEVSGGGKKPWRQKGTGRARQGSTRSAQWIKGGIVLGPKPRSYNYTLNKKLKRIALKSALSSKLASNELVVVDSLVLDQIKTKEMVKVLKNLKVDTSALIVTAEKAENIIKSVNNIPNVATALTNTINVYDILKAEKLVLTKDAVTKIEEVYA